MKYAITLFFIFVYTGASLAAPPTGVALSYDLETKTLHVTANHPSVNLDKDYLRRLVIYKNGVETQTIFFTRQKSPSGIKEDIPFEATAGDKIGVEIYASQGGTGSAEYTVPVKPLKELKK